MSLKIGNIVIPAEAGFNITQSYGQILARTLLRAKSGTGIPQSRWQKLRSTINGAGWFPAAMEGLVMGSGHAVHCVKALSAYGATTSITIPHSYRTDAGYTVQAFALVNGALVSTPVAMAGQEATLTAVSGATQYQVDYYPIITGLLTISKSGDVENETHGWTIEVEEL